jgi:tRNA nucleotidyltransferase (CCA-adding enzyme)
VEGDAIALGHAVVKKYGGRVTTHRRFGTAKWQIGEIRDELAGALSKVIGKSLESEDFPDTLDLVSARREFYTHPTALPTVESGSIKLDLHRRDFTINTLALRLDGRHYGELHDHWGGLADLHAGLVRVLHSLSFVDDPTRILRAVRFEQRFGYKIGTRTSELLVSALPLLDRVSGDRLRHELNTILQEPNALQMLARLAELDAFKPIHEKLEWNNEVQARLELVREDVLDSVWVPDKELDGYPPSLALSYVLWFMTLPRVDAASVTGRLKLPGWLTRIILAACNPIREYPEMLDGPPSKVVDRLEDVPHLALFAHNLVAEDERVRQRIQAFVKEWRHVQPVTTGHDLRARGVPPGPSYRRILDTLRAAWLDGKVTTQEEETALLEELLND